MQDLLPAGGSKNTILKENQSTNKADFNFFVMVVALSLIPLPQLTQLLLLNRSNIFFLPLAPNSTLRKKIAMTLFTLQDEILRIPYIST